MRFAKLSLICAIIRATCHRAQPRHALLKVLVKPGPVMAGMSAKVEVVRVNNHHHTPSLCLSKLLSQELNAGIPCVIEEVVEITTEAQIFRLLLVAQVGDGGGDAAAPVSPSRPASRPSQLRSEVTQASAAMAQPEDAEDKGLLAGHPGVKLPEVPKEVEYVPQDLDAMTLSQVKASS